MATDGGSLGWYRLPFHQTSATKPPTSPQNSTRVPPDQSAIVLCSLGSGRSCAQNFLTFIDDPKRHHPRQKGEEQLLMFETAVQEKRTGILWGVVVGLIA